MRAPSRTRELAADGTTCARLTAVTKLPSQSQWGWGLAGRGEEAVVGRGWGRVGVRGGVGLGMVGGGGGELCSGTLIYEGAGDLCQWA